MGQGLTSVSRSNGLKRILYSIVTRFGLDIPPTAFVLRNIRGVTAYPTIGGVIGSCWLTRTDKDFPESLLRRRWTSIERLVIEGSDYVNDSGPATPPWNYPAVYVYARVVNNYLIGMGSAVSEMTGQETTTANDHEIVQ